MKTRQQEAEEGAEIPLDRINPDTLRNLFEEFVMRERGDLSDPGGTLPR